MQRARASPGGATARGTRCRYMPKGSYWATPCPRPRQLPPAPRAVLQMHLFVHVDVARLPAGVHRHTYDEETGVIGGRLPVGERLGLSGEGENTEESVTKNSHAPHN